MLVPVKKHHPKKYAQLKIVAVTVAHILIKPVIVNQQK